jgi:hypothetical protein
VPNTTTASLSSVTWLCFMCFAAMVRMCLRTMANNSDSLPNPAHRIGDHQNRDRLTKMVRPWTLVVLEQT